MPRKKLIVTEGPYYSPGDEDAFFKWLQSIRCVEKVVGHMRGLHVTLRRQPSDSELREMIGLLRRYNLNMRPLAALKTKQNASWFYANRKAYWHARVFGKRKRRASS